MFERYGDVVTVGEMAEMLKIGRNTAYLLISSRIIPCIRVRRQIRIPKQGIIAYLAAPQGVLDSPHKHID